MIRYYLGEDAILPNVPTMAEVGIADFVTVSFFGLLAPAETPREIIMKLNGAVETTMGTAEAKSALAKLSLDIQVGSPENFASFLTTERARWEAVVKAAGLRAD